MSDIDWKLPINGEHKWIPYRYFFPNKPVPYTFTDNPVVYKCQECSELIYISLNKLPDNSINVTWGSGKGYVEKLLEFGEVKTHEEYQMHKAMK